jgi:hypothetical protein
MAAVVIYPMASLPVPVGVVDSKVLAAIIAAATLLILAVGFGLVVVDRRLAQAQLAETRQQDLRRAGRAIRSPLSASD